MTATPVQTTLEERVLEWTEQLCDSLAENYKQYHRRMIEANNAYFNADGNKELSKYAQKQIDEMDNGTANLMKFRIQSGRKYYKIIQQDFDTFRDRNEYRDGGVHAFVNKKTGELHKADSWKSPSKHVRYDLRIIKEREYVLDPRNCGWAGGYLYQRG
jgi:hypothetical protein|tara:strand:- start:29 stop:502 length:474 start_codon:yes stop_codon:yes gene_type:complete